jgi:hypothetical protein
MAKKQGARNQDQQSFAGTNGNGGGAQSSSLGSSGGVELPQSRDGLISNEEIAARAYEIYEREGRSDGRAMDHWLQAENELRSERQRRRPQTTQTDQPRSARLHQGETAAM